MDIIHDEKIIEMYNINASIDGINIIRHQMMNSVCRIIKEEGNGTGFFCKLRYDNKNGDKNFMKTLITNNHVIGRSDLKERKEIFISWNNRSGDSYLKLNDSRVIFTDEDLDATIIELKENDKINCDFLEIDPLLEKEKKNLKKYLEKKAIYIIHYPKNVNENENVYSSFGTLSQIIENKSQINYFCSTEEGSSGSPILSLSTNKIIGLHKGSSPNFNYNIGNSMKDIIDKFLNYLNYLNNEIHRKNYYNYNKDKIINNKDNINVVNNKYKNNNNNFNNNTKISCNKNNEVNNYDNNKRNDNSNTNFNYNKNQINNFNKNNINFPNKINNDNIESNNNRIKKLDIKENIINNNNKYNNIIVNKKKYNNNNILKRINNEKSINTNVNKRKYIFNNKLNKINNEINKKNNIFYEKLNIINNEISKFYTNKKNNISNENLNAINNETNNFYTFNDNLDKLNNKINRFNTNNKKKYIFNDNLNIINNKDNNLKSYKKEFLSIKNKKLFNNNFNNKNNNNKLNNSYSNLNDILKFNFTNEIGFAESFYDSLKNYSIPPFNINKFQKIKKIGEGSFGKVYSVKERLTNNEYAIKNMYCEENYEIFKYLEEFDFLYKTSHENIIKVYNYSISIEIISPSLSKKSLSILMEKGKCNWEEEIEKRKKNRQYYTIEEIILILVQLTSGLIFLQINGMAHRDIKPQNILVFPQNIYKITDLGEAKMNLNNQKAKHTFAGTQYFMSPLLYNGLTQKKDTVNHNPFKSDVYSLGLCILYAMTLDINIIKIVREKKYFKNKKKMIEDMAKNMPNYSLRLWRIVFKMIEYEEDNRYDFIELGKHLIIL